MVRDRVFITAGSKLCEEHYLQQEWGDIFTPNSNGYQWTRDQIEDMTDLLRSTSTCDETKNGPVDLDIGLSTEQFFELLNSLKSLQSAVQSAAKAEMCLRMFLVRLRKAYTYEDIGDFFKVSANTATTMIRKARKALLTDFVPLHLGFDSLGRDGLQTHTTDMSRALYCSRNSKTIVTMWDGTYIYTQKSSNYAFQRHTFSGQKHRNLVKPMLCVCPDGFIVDIFGPFKGTTNDAKIMDSIFENNPEINTVLQPNDVFVIDRGFRDCAKHLEEMKYVVQMPKFTDSKAPTAQFTTMQANLSRLVTKSRWVVEARNAHLKFIWPIFGRIWINSQVVHLMDDIRIAAAFINKYYGTLDTDINNAPLIVEKMLQNVNTVNSLHTLVRKATFQKVKKTLPLINVENFDFPILSADDLKMISLGVYQLKNARSYVVDHIKAGNTSTYNCFYCPPDIIEKFFRKLIDQKGISQPINVMTQMRSRFRSGVTYDSFILVDGSKTGAHAIESYFCECKHGLRTVGCCSHVMTTIYYLSYARHRGGANAVAPYLDHIFANE